MATLAAAEEKTDLNLRRVKIMIDKISQRAGELFQLGYY